MDLYRERLVSTNASEVEEISVEGETQVIAVISAFDRIFCFYNFLLQLSLFL